MHLCRSLLDDEYDVCGIDNMNNYYEIAVLLNEERMNHWRKVREIANEDQIRKLDSIWSRMKDRIRSSSE